MVVTILESVLYMVKSFHAGSMTPVYYGLQEINGALDNYGEIIGQIPQVEQTYTYFHSAYSHMNEFQLAIAESTLSQRSELQVDRESGKTNYDCRTSYDLCLTTL